MKIKQIALLVVLVAALGCSPAAADESPKDLAESPDTMEQDDSDETVDPDDEDRADSETEHSTEDPAQLPPHEQPHPRDRVYDISEVYAEACVVCHGERGDGKGTEQQTFDFSTPADDWNNAPDVDGILETLEYGVHDSAMQAFPRLTNDDRVALAKYVLDLRYQLQGEQTKATESDDTTPRRE